MAFGFFKKKTVADIVFHNGHIYTHDEDYLYADAVACADGKIIAVGEFDGMDEFIDGDTEVVDLQGKFMFPGFIDVHRSPVMRCFQDKYIDLTDCQDGDEVCGMIADWVYNNPYGDVIFAYGYKENLEPDKDKLEEACEGRPALLMCENTVNCIINSAAAKIVEETAEEECVQIVTPAYIFNLLLPFDFEEIEEAVQEDIESLCDRGITTVLNLAAPSFFESIYQDSLVAMFNEGQVKQRFYGSYMMNRPLVEKGLIYQLMNRKTSCVELGGLVNAETLYISLDKNDCPIDFTEERLTQIMSAVSDKGFHIFIEAASHDDVLKAYTSCEQVRKQGYKNTLIIASDSRVSEEDLAGFEYSSSVLRTWRSNPSASHPVYGEVKTTAQAVDEMTVNAAKLLGAEDFTGKIEKGRAADFAVFERNPLECDLRTLAGLHAEMTVIGGNIVYDAEHEMLEELYDIMLTSHL